MRLWILCFLVFCAGSSLAQHDGLEYDGMYEDLFPTENEDDTKADVKHPDDVNKNYGKANEDLENAENGYETIGDYQFEDNRSSESNDKQNIVEEPTEPVDSKTYDKDIEEKDAGNEETTEKDYSGTKNVVEESKELVDPPASDKDIEEEDAEYEETPESEDSPAYYEGSEDNDAGHEENSENVDSDADSNVEELTKPVDSPADDDDIEYEDAGHEENSDNVDSDADSNVEEPTEPKDSPSNYDDIKDEDAGHDHEENPENSDANDNVEEPTETEDSPADDIDIEYEDAGHEENRENVYSDANNNVEEPTKTVDSPADDDGIEDDTGYEENPENIESDANDNVEEPTAPVDSPANYEGSEDNDAGYEENPENDDSEADDIIDDLFQLVDAQADDDDIEEDDQHRENSDSKADDIVEEPTEQENSPSDNEGTVDSDAGHEENSENDGSEADNIVEDDTNLMYSLSDDKDTEDKDAGYKENADNDGFEADDHHLILEDNDQADDYKNTDSINLSDVINRLQEQMDQYEDVERSKEQYNSDEEQVKDSNINDGEQNEDKQLNDMAQNIDYNNDQDTQNESDEDTVIKVYADLDDDLKKLLETFRKLKDDTEENSYANDDDKDDDDDSEMSVNDNDSDNQETDKNKNDSEMDQDRNDDEVSAVITGRSSLNSEEISGTEVDTALSSTVSTITGENEDNKPSPTEYNDYADALLYDRGDKAINQERNEHTSDSDMVNKITDQEDSAMLPNSATFLIVNSSQDYDHSTVIPSDDHSTDAPFISQNIDPKTLAFKDSEYSNDKLSDGLSYHGKYAALYSTVSTNTEENEGDEPTDATPEQYDVLMKKFITEHSESIKSDHFDPQTIRSILSPVFVTLTDETPHVIVSPNYPNHYPTDNVIEYHINAEGSGIELNITDFSVNGNTGDYLLIKPGGVYASDDDTMVISYHLSEKHMYRFVDVDRLYMRFNSGSVPRKGFQLSVRMLYKQEPSPVLTPISFTVVLGGRTPMSFGEVQEDFRRLIASMAEKYVEESDIDPKQMVNDTWQAVQISSTASCYNPIDLDIICENNSVAVNFRVPVIYEDGRDVRFNFNDLSYMWYTYHRQEPYATELQKMGLTVQEPQPEPQPEQRQIRMLTVWLVIGAGVLISAAMLAVALWRFSCYESYARMPAYSDTDSLTKKRVLDMYPTPHQAFPALYAEQQLTWDDDKFDEATRVDMDGYANLGFAHKLLDMESDDDVKTTPRDRNSISPSDVYQV